VLEVEAGVRDCSSVGTYKDDDVSEVGAIGGGSTKDDGVKIAARSSESPVVRGTWRKVHDFSVPSRVSNELSGGGCWGIEGVLETSDVIAGERSDKSPNLE
jgi:hypothetical protein